MAQMSQGKCCTVFVGNIPYDAQEEELKNIFSRVGAVESFRLVFDKDTKQPKGYGFCDYCDADTALSAIRNLNEVEFSGRRLRIDLADNTLRSREGTSKLAIAPSPSSEPRPSQPALPAALPAATMAPAPQLALPMPPGMAPPRPAPSGSPGVFPPAGDPTSAAAEATAAMLDAPGMEVSVHTEIAQTVAAMPRAQLQLCLGTMQRLAIEDPESSRALLQENPQLCHALLHAQLLLGLAVEPTLPPDPEEVQRLRAEASARPTAPTAGSGMLLMQNMPGMLGGPPRIGLGLPGAGGMGATSLLPRPMPLVPLRRPTVLGPMPAQLSSIGLAAKAPMVRPPCIARPVVMPGLRPMS
mmetsp:Transcript_2167/g.5011  ORF Transcript_2167/g.5011 Transcript_2167/m.5011 type:complete len:355 (-) Transcript_2167:59-1123(-)